MSAIGGMLYFDKRPLTDELEKMQGVLRVYGRDVQRTWANGHVGLLATLNHVMVEDAFDRQPWSEHHFHVVADCRIDNRQELGRQLGIDAADARCMSDSQFILKAYMRWGELCVDYLQGDYAFAVWDAQKAQLFLARDPIGNKPLFWYRQDSVFAFASMPKGLCSLPFIPREINQVLLLDQIARIPQTDESSLFKNIFRIKPGFSLTVNQHEIKRNKFFSIDLDKRLHLKNDQEYLEAFSEIFTAATKDRLRTNGKIASHLSSGFDSSIVTAVAAQLLQQEGRSLTAYTAIPRPGFDGPVPEKRIGNEGPVAQLLAQRFGNIHHQLITANTTQALDRIVKLTLLSEQPVRNFFNLGWISAIIEQAAATGHTVLLNGVKGNMTISYQGMELLPELFGGGHWFKLLQEVYYLNSAGGTSYRQLAARAVGPCLPSWLRSAAHAVFRTKKHMPMGEHSTLRQTQASGPRAMARPMDWYEGGKSWRNSRLMRLSFFEKNDLGPMYKMHEAMGVERRSPCSDLRLLEFCLSIPLDQYLRKGQSRFLLKKFAANLLPNEILTGSHRGYQAADWYLSLLEHRDEFERRSHEFAQLELYRDVMNMASDDSGLLELPGSEWETPAVVSKFRNDLGNKISVGTFVRQFSAGHY